MIAGWSVSPGDSVGSRPHSAEATKRASGRAIEGRSSSIARGTGSDGCRLISMRPDSTSLYIRSLDADEAVKAALHGPRRRAGVLSNGPVRSPYRLIRLRVITRYGAEDYRSS